LGWVPGVDAWVSGTDDSAKNQLMEILDKIQAIISGEGIGYPCGESMNRITAKE